MMIGSYVQLRDTSGNPAVSCMMAHLILQRNPSSHPGKLGDY